MKLTRLRDIRERKLITLRRLSALTGIPIATLSRIENDRQQPRLSTIQRIVDALQVSVDDLLDKPASEDKAEVKP